jgi:hypothetical protein
LPAGSFTQICGSEYSRLALRFHADPHLARGIGTFVSGDLLVQLFDHFCPQRRVEGLF